MKHYRLFQAWQNQNKEYTDFITATLKEVVKRQRLQGNDIEIVRFPAQDQSGSPDIVNMVWEQIANCDLFVGDLTEIASSDDNHVISNPNVMYEIGIADALLGEKRVILLCSKETDVANLAFDINHKRISPLGIRNQGAANVLQEWIASGISECEMQNLQRDFILQPLYDDLYVAYNNFMRMIYSDDYEYSEGVLPPTKEKIKEKLHNALLNELMISVDYSCIVNRLKEEIRDLYDSNNKRFLKDIICIYRALDKYNWFVHSVKRQIVFSETETKLEYVLNDTGAFYISKLEGAEAGYGSILFQSI